MERRVVIKKINGTAEGKVRREMGLRKTNSLGKTKQKKSQKGNP